MGDAVGNTYKKLGQTTTDDECADLVRSKEPMANGASRGQVTGPCYAIFGATGTDCNSDFQTCLFLSRCSLSKRSVEDLSKHA